MPGRCPGGRWGGRWGGRVPEGQVPRGHSTPPVIGGAWGSRIGGAWGHSTPLLQVVPHPSALPPRLPRCRGHSTPLLQVVPHPSALPPDAPATDAAPRCTAPRGCPEVRYRGACARCRLGLALFIWAAGLGAAPRVGVLLAIATGFYMTSQRSVMSTFEGFAEYCTAIDFFTNSLEYCARCAPATLSPTLKNPDAEQAL